MVGNSDSYVTRFTFAFSAAAVSATLAATTAETAMTAPSGNCSYNTAQKAYVGISFAIAVAYTVLNKRDESLKPRMERELFHGCYYVDLRKREFLDKILRLIDILSVAK